MSEVSSRQFVILRHEVGEGLSRTRRCHFDWMFQTGEVLKTWSTEPFSITGTHHQAIADAIADHRIDYLNFEGEISGGRGSVTRVARGTFNLLDHSPDRFEAVITWDDDSQRTYQRTVLIARRVEGVDAGSWSLRISG